MFDGPTEALLAVLTRVTVVAMAALVAACEFPITAATERAWQENFPEGLVPGYSKFEGVDVNSDIAWYLFRYELPQGYDPALAVPQLRKQIRHEVAVTGGTGKGGSCYRVVLETSAELQLRCRILTLGQHGYDEWRVLVDAHRRRVTVMFGNLDSPVEQAAYPHLVEALQRAHRD